MAASAGSLAGFAAEEIDISPRAKVSAFVRESDAQSAKEYGEKNTLWISAMSAISNISLRYTRFQAPIHLFEWDMHDLWHLYYHASMNTNHERSEQDRLVGQILYARELGVLSRQRENTLEEAVTSDGKIWKDLPFLVEDMTEYWIRGKMTTSQRTNFASFLAKLSAVGVAENKLCGCALVVLRDTLETTRFTVNVNAVASETQEYQDSEHDRRSTESLSIADLLPAVNMWFFKAGNKIIELSQNSADLFPSHISMLGDLARAEGVVPEHGGFSPQRWLFWLKRLETLELDPGLAAIAHGIKNNMVITSCESDSVMSRELGRRGLLLY